ncbi:MAG: hypothetical protein J0I34_17330 [Pseudonocardia sp.]|uniref:hypothetical protein n=1 Tax=unclassified Pseudonocardia TaxID=2619320 RepID=UPI00086F54AE|nr:MULTISPECIES: hypothetical protein [unclassified Pseudonocardia]MBN9110527.1 hypothetical protein [Pseudonocardia sp.]ODV00697.1 MAG: hypothetical protein ABT15_28955 [Pseudonocardia sp. SCN 73-27]
MTEVGFRTATTDDRGAIWPVWHRVVAQATGPRADALRDVVTDLLDTPAGATYRVSTIGGDRQRYAAGPRAALTHWR